jgi:CRP-like cAMP-binding protein
METTNRLLASLGAAERDALAPHLRPHGLNLGEVLYDHGQPITDVHFVDGGIVSMVTIMLDGGSVETALIGREGLVGDGAAFRPSPHFGRALIQAEGATQKIEVARLHELLDRNLGLRNLLEAYSNAMTSEAQQNAACNAVHRLEGRLAKWLLRCHDRLDGDSIPMTQEFLSYMLGAQRTTVTEVARRLQFAGLIRYSRGKIEVLDRAGLEKATCECYGAVQDRMADLGLPGSTKRMLA